MKKAVIFICLFICGHCVAQWQLVSSGYPGVMLTDITTTPSGIIFAVGTGVNGTTYTPVVFRSRDNGFSWDTMHVQPQGYFFQTIAFLDDSIGYIGVGGGAYILQTTNGGISWNYFYSNSPATAINDIEVIDSLTAVACGFGSIFYTDGTAYILAAQNHWSVAQSFPTATLDDMQMLNHNDGYALSLFGKKIFKTTNGGQLWTLIDSFPSTVEKMFWQDTNTGIAVGLNANYYRTSDGGLNWTRDSIAGYNDELTGIAFMDANIGFVCAAGGKLFTTTDGGNTWAIEPTITNNNLYNLEIHGGTAYAVGENGIIARYEIPSTVYDLKWKPVITVFPNPANDRINFESDEIINRVLISDIYGRNVISAYLSKKDFVLNISELKPGSYFVRSFMNNSFTTKKIIKK